jgi:hypothetical protein
VGHPVRVREMVRTNIRFAVLALKAVVTVGRSGRKIQSGTGNCACGKWGNVGEVRVKYASHFFDSRKAGSRTVVSWNLRGGIEENDKKFSEESTVQPEFRPGHLPRTSQKHYRLRQLARFPS